MDPYADKIATAVGAPRMVGQETAEVVSIVKDYGAPCSAGVVASIARKRGVKVTEASVKRLVRAGVLVGMKRGRKTYVDIPARLAFSGQE